jgi:hypothetical protein
LVKNIRFGINLFNLRTPYKKIVINSVLLMICKNFTASVFECASVLQNCLQKTFGQYNLEQFPIEYIKLEFRT